MTPSFSFFLATQFTQLAMCKCILRLKTEIEITITRVFFYFCIIFGDVCYNKLRVHSSDRLTQNRDVD